MLGDGGLDVGTFWHGRLCCICRLGSIGKLSCVAFWIKLVVSSPAVLPDTTTINFLFIVGGILVVSAFGHPLWPPLEAYHHGALVAWLGFNAVARLVNTTGASRRVVTVSLFRHTLAWPRLTRRILSTLLRISSIQFTSSTRRSLAL